MLSERSWFQRVACRTIHLYKILEMMKVRIKNKLVVGSGWRVRMDVVRESEVTKQHD